MSKCILFIDDEPELLHALQFYFKNKGFDVRTAASGEEGLHILKEEVVDLLVTDMSMGGMDGLQVLRRTRDMVRSLPVIIMTGVGTIESAVQALQEGAYHYITKPFQMDALLEVVTKAIDFSLLNKGLEASEDNTDELEEENSMVVGSHQAIQEMLHTIRKVSNSRVPVLIQGETGTGKSLFARRIHHMSSRSDKPFLTIDCAALSANLLESELFGHVRGAFTGAVTGKRGLLEEAQGGTVFLDEIGELSPVTQVKLLHAIQELEIKPVGGNSQIKIDVRFVSATSRSLKTEVKTGGFRKDLYYRLAVIPLYLPPLRERQGDLLLFVDHFVHKFNKIYGKSVTQVHPLVLQYFLNASWPGNIRELEHVIERAVLLAEGSVITYDCLNTHGESYGDFDEYKDYRPLSLKEMIEETEKKAINQALIVTGGNRNQAASLLGIARRTLYDKIAAYGLT